jgi:hypothetical protein
MCADAVEISFTLVDIKLIVNKELEIKLVFNVVIDRQ